MKRACSLGSATHDIFMEYEGADTLHLHQARGNYSYIVLPQGAKIDISHVSYATGGGGTNVAVGLARLGIDVEAFFRTGDDPAGAFIRQKMAEENVATSRCPIDKKHQTALSIIIPSRENDHVALCYRAANRHQTKETFPLQCIQNLDLLFIGPLGGISQELLPFIAPAANNAGSLVAINPSMDQITEGKDALLAAVSHVDIIFINARESAYLLQALLKEDHEPFFTESTHNQPSLLNEYVRFNSLAFTIKDVMQQIIACGPKIVAITNGAEGVYVGTSSALYFYPSIATNPAHSLGAGDAFSSGFLGTYIQGYSIEQALKYGVLNAHSVIKYQEAKAGLLSIDDLSLLAKNWGTQEPSIYPF